MKDLQDLFEEIGYEEVKWLSECSDKKSLNPTSVEKILDYVAKVYCAENNIQEQLVDEAALIKMCQDIQFNASIYLGVLDGHMEITSGRLTLTGVGEQANFRLTKKGIDHVENNLLKP
jgi:hypothetical protein